MFVASAPMSWPGRAYPRADAVVLPLDELRDLLTSDATARPVHARAVGPAVDHPLAGRHRGPGRRADRRVRRASEDVNDLRGTPGQRLRTAAAPVIGPPRQPSPTCWPL